nr:M48 family metallopeptidase [Bacilli bacterium]
MVYEIDGINYNVIIERKNNKNTYIRIKDDLSIYVTTNYFTSERDIIKLLNDNYNYLSKMIQRKKKHIEKDNAFYLFGKKYDIIIDSSVDKIYLSGNKIYVSDMNKFNKWLKKETLKLYKEHLDKIYNEFEENIPYPKLKIRDMKTRWGVNNKRDNSVTLNSKLITFDLSKLDYVIVHELAHFVHFDHSKAFWEVVSKYYPNYKEVRKEMKE